MCQTNTDSESTNQPTKILHSRKLLRACTLKSLRIPHDVSPPTEVIVSTPGKDIRADCLPYNRPGQRWEPPVGMVTPEKRRAALLLFLSAKLGLKDAGPGDRKSVV